MIWPWVIAGVVIVPLVAVLIPIERCRTRGPWGPLGTSGAMRDPQPRIAPGGPGPSRQAGVVDAAKDHPTSEDNGLGAYRCSANAEAVDRKER